MIPRNDTPLHQLARLYAAQIEHLDKKQLRFNDIVGAAQHFYNDASEGVLELIMSCGRGSPLYVPTAAMGTTLDADYRWMLGASPHAQAP